MRTQPVYIDPKAISDLPDDTPICEICGELCADKYRLKRHQDVHKPGKFSCPICKKVFRQNSNMKTHLRIHTGETPYGCTHCGRRFTAKCSLSRHERIHENQLAKARRIVARRMPSLSPCPTDISNHSDDSCYTTTSAESSIWSPVPTYRPLELNPPSATTSGDTQDFWFVGPGSDPLRKNYMAPVEATSERTSHFATSTMFGGRPLYETLPAQSMSPHYDFLGNDSAYPIEPKQQFPETITNNVRLTPSPDPSFPTLASESLEQWVGYEYHTPSYSTGTMHPPLHCLNSYPEGDSWAMDSTIPSTYVVPAPSGFGPNATTSVVHSTASLSDPVNDHMHPTEMLPPSWALDLN